MFQALNAHHQEAASMQLASWWWAFNAWNMQRNAMDVL